MGGSRTAKKRPSHLGYHRGWNSGDASGLAVGTGRAEGWGSRLEVMMSDFVLVPRPAGPGVTEYALASFLARYPRPSGRPEPVNGHDVLRSAVRGDGTQEGGFPDSTRTFEQDDGIVDHPLESCAQHSSLDDPVER